METQADGDQSHVRGPEPAPVLEGSASEFLSNREQLFWLLHVVGWFGYGVAVYLGELTQEAGTPQLVFVAAATVSGMLFSLVLRYVYRQLWYQPLPFLAVTALVMCYAMALLWTLVRNQVLWDLNTPWYQPETVYQYFAGAMNSTYVLMCWSGLYFGIKYYRMLQQQTERALRADAAAHQAQLMMLRYQLNPHFLFNTLNAISTLILENDSNAANKCIARLSEFLRYTLDTDAMRQVTLDRELETLDLYLEIEKVRFGERLRLEFDIQSAARRCLVPNLIMQPLIENAIKYAVAPSALGASIRITAKTGGSFLVLKVIDDGPGLRSSANPAAHFGVGLRNTDSRLAQLYGNDYALTLAQGRPHGVVVTLRIPIAREVP